MVYTNSLPKKHARALVQRFGTIGHLAWLQCWRQVRWVDHLQASFENVKSFGHESREVQIQARFELGVLVVRKIKLGTKVMTRSHPFEWRKKVVAEIFWARYDLSIFF